jgi:hypothetical protein
VLALSLIVSGIALAATVVNRNGFEPLVPRRITGAAFVLGFVLLGVAISHWRFE